jgi:nitronate monooxygenase
MSLNTRLTGFFGIEHPILLAPMAMISGGRLAAAVTAAGGLGLIGAGHGDAEWSRSEIGQTGGARVGFGFITWSLARNPELVDTALAQQPAAIMLSFGDPRPFADRIRVAGVPLIAQVQTVDQVRQALDVGADIVVAQGGDAGGNQILGRPRGLGFAPSAPAGHPGQRRRHLSHSGL